MNKKLNVSLLCTKKGLGSKSLRAVALGLSTSFGYKVWRTTRPNIKRQQFKYGQSVDKLTQYKWFKEQGIPALEFTNNPEEAKVWLANGCVVFGRSILNGSCGKGIIVHEDGQTIQPCPVYTKYKKKKREFRVHVFKDSVVAVVEKKRKKGFEGQRDTKIRNLANGYVFVQQFDNEPAGLRELALKASKVSGSDFRGVDIGYNEKKDELFVIEVNSAPGIVGNNIEQYVNTILNYV